MAWLKSGQAIPKAFKSPAVFALFQEYCKRIAHFLPCSIQACAASNRNNPTTVWVCEREKGSRSVSSEALARELQACMNSGVQELQIVIGGPDGFTTQELETMKPVFRWSFGPMTLPHELAAVVAAEQIYRALTILRNFPYHSKH